MSKKVSAAKPCEGWRHAVDKFKRAVSMEITIEDRTTDITGVEFQKLKTVSEGRGEDEMKGALTYQQKNFVSEPPNTHGAHSIEMTRPSCIVSKCKREK